MENKIKQAHKLLDDLITKGVAGIDALVANAMLNKLIKEIRTTSLKVLENRKKSRAKERE